MGEAWGLEAFSTIGRIMSITKRIRVGTGVVSIYSRSPATIAMACATLNQIAPGRFLLGLGASGRGLVESFHGAKFENPFKRSEEYVEAIKKIQTGELVDYSGKDQPGKIRLFTAPVNPPIPIYLGAIGERNLAFAGQVADGAIVTIYPLSKLTRCRDIVRQGNESKKVFVYVPTLVTNNEREEEAGKLAISKLIAFYVASMGKYYAQNLIKLGYEKQVEEIRRVAALKGTLEAARTIPEEFLRDFSLVGKPTHIIDKLAHFPDGVTPVLAFNASSPKDGEISTRAIRDLSAALTR